MSINALNFHLKCENGSFFFEIDVFLMKIISKPFTTTIYQNPWRCLFFSNVQPYYHRINLDKSRELRILLISSPDWLLWPELSSFNQMTMNTKRTNNWNISINPVQQNDKGSRSNQAKRQDNDKLIKLFTIHYSLAFIFTYVSNLKWNLFSIFISTAIYKM